MDNTFRKPYEYQEDKRGLIILFISMILSIDTIQTIAFATQTHMYMSHIPVLSYIIFIMATLFILYIIYTAVVVYRMKSNFVVSAKTYLFIRTIFSLLLFLSLFFNRFKHENLIGESEEQYSSVISMLYLELFMPLFFILLFSIGWYLYFTYSKRTRNVSR